MQAEEEHAHHNGHYQDEQTTDPYAGPIAELSGYQVADDDDDDPVLLNADGSPVDTWRQDYPYDERLPRAEYDHDKRLLQIELLKLQNWCKATSATSATCRRPVRSCCSTGPGTTGPASNA